MLQRVADAGLLKGKTVGIDATTLEANAALRSIVRRDTGEGYDAFLRGLAAASGIPTPTRAELARLDRKRPKKGSNDEWTNPHDPDAKIAKMKDGRTRMAYTAEHAVDLETGAVVGVTVQDASEGDTTTMVETLVTAAEQVEAVLPAGGGLAEVVADKGYHSNETMVALSGPGAAQLRVGAGPRAAPLARPTRRPGRRVCQPAADPEARGRRLLRQRGERLERPNAHLYETGRLRRVHLRGYANIRKRLLVHVCGFNLGLLLRRLTGVGTPRTLQGRARALFDALKHLLGRHWRLVSLSEALVRPRPPDPSSIGATALSHLCLPLVLPGRPLATAC